MKKIGRALKIRIYSFLGWLLILVLSKTLRVRTINEPDWEGRREGKRVAFAFWHGQQFPLYYYHRKRNISIPTSLSTDGQILGRILRRLGYEVVSGSSSRGGIRVLSALIRRAQAGWNVAIAVDGPRGEIYKVKPGIALLAQQARSAIVPVATWAKWNKRFTHSWDHYMLPFPFSRTVIIYGEPIEVGPQLDKGNLEELLKRLGARLNELSHQAQHYLLKSEIPFGPRPQDRGRIPNSEIQNSFLPDRQGRRTEFHSPLLGFYQWLFWNQNKETPIIKVLLLPLWTLSMIYKMVVSLRRWFYRSGSIKARRLKGEVISVGNITVGGTGKTPVVQYIAQKLQREGKKVAILNRGYRGLARERVNIISDGEQIKLPYPLSNDESYMLARNLPRIPILTGRDRFSLGDYAQNNFGVDTILLDDGFQYLGLYRQKNIVLIDAQNPIGNGHLLPRGPLREPTRSLQDADLIWFTNWDSSIKRETLDPLITTPLCGAGRPIVFSSCSPDTVLSLDFSKSWDSEILRGKKVLAFCGIASPQNFFQTIINIGAQLVGKYIFPDHHPYQIKELGEIERASQRAEADYILTTEKDAVRVPPELFPRSPFQILRVKLDIIEGQEKIQKILGLTI